MNKNYAESLSISNKIRVLVVIFVYRLCLSNYINSIYILNIFMYKFFIYTKWLKPKCRN